MLPPGGRTRGSAGENNPIIPLKDGIPHERFPYVTAAIIVSCTAATVAQWAIPPEALPAYVDAVAVVPARYNPFPWNRPWEAYRFATAVFLHKSWLHLAGNMLFLFVFGDNVEDRFGRTRFLLFFLGCGFLSFAFQAVFQLNAQSHNMGSSGAIAAVLGAYLTLFPRVRIATVNPLLIPPIVYLPAFLFLLYWFLVQFWMGIIAIGPGGVAWWAHVGGFLTGAAIRAAVLRDPGYRAKIIVW